MFQHHQETTSSMEGIILQPVEPGPVKLIIGILYSDEVFLQQSHQLLGKQFGPIDFFSSSFDFTISDYYIPEMGSPIFRQFISFEQLVHPKDIAKIKITTNKIEDELAVQGKRKVNLDSGYLDFDKLVLASAKYNGNKIYIDQGIWADLTLHYEKGKYDPYPWSFPDFKQGLYDSVFLEIRTKYKKQRKEN